MAGEAIAASVIICTRNRARELGRCLAAVARQMAPFAWEALVVDNASGDDTRAVTHRAMAADPHLRYVFEPETGLSRARNRGATDARGDVLAYLDDDAEPTIDWLDAVVTAFRETRAAIVGGPILARFEVDGPAWLKAHVSTLSCQDYGPVRRFVDAPPYLFGANFAVRRAEVVSGGGFDEALGRKGDELLAFEETDLCERLIAAGQCLVYEPRAVVYHWFGAERLSRAYLRRRARDTGRALAIELGKKQGARRVAIEVGLKALKLPGHALLWAGAALTRQHESAIVRERSVLVTLGIFAELSKRRRARKACSPVSPEEMRGS